MFTAYYATIRYVPDVFRKEFMNIGAVVASPELGYVSYDIYATKTRLEQLDPLFEMTAVDNFSEFFDVERKEYESWLIEAYQKDRKAGHHDGEELPVVEGVLYDVSIRYATSKIQLSRFEWADFEVKQTEAIHLDYFLRDLMERYVKRRKAPRKAVHRSLRSLFRDDLKRLDLLPSSSRAPGVLPNYKLVEDEELRFDFGFKNGQIHLFELIDVSMHEVENDAIRRDAGEVLVKFAEAEDIAEQKKEQIENIVLLRLGDLSRYTLRKPLELLAKHSTIYEYDDEEERDQLFEHIRNALYGEPPMMMD